MREGLLMIKKVCNGVWKINANSNLYFLNFEEKILIDTGQRKYYALIEQFLSKVVELERIKKVIFTHLHFDHIGNFDLFRNAEFFAGKEEIKSFKENPVDTVLNEDMVKKFNIKLNPAEEFKFKEIEIISTPGHTKGSICIWYPKESILFSGDTIFSNKAIGRTDFPNSSEEEMRKSLMKLVDYNFRILCPGHD